MKPADTISEHEDAIRLADSSRARRAGVQIGQCVVDLGIDLAPLGGGSAGLSPVVEHAATKPALQASNRFLRFILKALVAAVRPIDFTRDACNRIGNDGCSHDRACSPFIEGANPAAAAHRATTGSTASSPVCNRYSVAARWLRQQLRDASCARRGAPSRAIDLDGALADDLGRQLLVQAPVENAVSTLRWRAHSDSRSARARCARARRSRSVASRATASRTAQAAPRH